MGKRIFLMCILTILVFGFQLADAGTMVIQPSAPTVEVSGRTTLSVSGASGYVTWQSVNGTIQGSGQSVTYIAPSAPGADSVAASDSAGNTATINITVVLKGSNPMPYIRENAAWQIYSSRNEIRAMTYSDDGKFLWVGTEGGIEKRVMPTAELVRVYTQTDGLPSVSVNALISDFNGGLWAGTDKGLVHLKSDDSVQVSDTGNSALPNNTVNAFLSDGSGGLWIGTGGGLAHLKSDGSYKVLSSALFNVVYDLLSDGKSGLWLGTSGGIVHLKSDGTWEAVNAGQTGILFNNVYAIASDNKGGLWAGSGSGSGLAHLKSDGTWEYFDSKNSSLPAQTVSCIQTDINGVWAGTDGGGLAKMDSNGAVQVWDAEPSDLPDSHIKSILTAGNDGFWVGTQKGLAHLHADGSVDVLNQENPGLSGNKVLAIESDTNNSVWIGTDKGLAHLNSNGLWDIYDKSSSSLPDNTVYAILSDGTGGVWIGTGGGLAHLKSDRSWQIFTTDNSKLPGNIIYALESDGRKGLWIGIGKIFLSGGGLAHLRSDGSWEIVSSSSGNPFGSTQSTGSLPDNSVKSLYMDSNSGLWIGMESGGLAYRKVSGAFDVYDTTSGLPSNKVLSVIGDGLGGIWVGTDVGLANRSKDGNWSVYRKDNSGLPDNTVRSLINDGYNGLWVGTGNGLAYFYSNGSWDVFDNTNSGLPNTGVNFLFADNNGILWIGTDGGLARLSFSEKPSLAANIQDQTIKNSIISGVRAAVIVQPRGGEDERQNAAFRQMAAYAYKTLKARGYDSNEIYFLSDRPNADVTGDFTSDYNSVDGPVTMSAFNAGTKARDISLADIQAAYNWAVGKGKLDQPLLFIFIGQGTGDALKLSPYGDMLKASDLNTMTNQYQKTSGNKVIMILEAPYCSNLFKKLFGTNRILIGSSNGNLAYYDDIGMISFSNLFFNALREGNSFNKAFHTTADQLTALKSPFDSQSPILDDSGDGQFTSGDGTVADTFCLNSCFNTPEGITLAPQNSSGSVSSGKAVTLSVTTQITGTAIQHLWAVVMGPQSAKNRDGQGFPLTPSPVVNIGNNSQFSGFNYRGDYVVVFIAKDTKGFFTLSSPVIFNLAVGPDVTLNPVTSQSVYYNGNQAIVSIPDAVQGKTRYVRMYMPGVTNPIIFTALNTGTVFDGQHLSAWNGAAQVINLQITSQIPRGAYRIQVIFVPTGTDALSHPEAWQIGETTFSIADAPLPDIAAPIVSQTSYHNGEQCNVSLPSLPQGKKQYVGMMIPGSKSLFMFTALNKVSAFDGKTLPVWSGGDTVLNLQITSQIPRGEYSIYLLRVPDTIADPLTRTDVWEVGVTKFITN